jgi:hypothetical protein
MEADVTESEPTTAAGTELLFENELIRVWETLLGPGDSSPIHATSMTT